VLVQLVHLDTASSKSLCSWLVSLISGFEPRCLVPLCNTVDVTQNVTLSFEPDSPSKTCTNLAGPVYDSETLQDDRADGLLAHMAIPRTPPEAKLILGSLYSLIQRAAAEGDDPFR